MNNANKLWTNTTEKYYFYVKCMWIKTSSYLRVIRSYNSWFMLVSLQNRFTTSGQSLTSTYLNSLKRLQYEAACGCLRKSWDLKKLIRLLQKRETFAQKSQEIKILTFHAFFPHYWFTKKGAPVELLFNTVNKTGTTEHEFWLKWPFKFTAFLITHTIHKFKYMFSCAEKQSAC